MSRRSDETEAEYRERQKNESAVVVAILIAIGTAVFFILRWAFRSRRNFAIFATGVVVVTGIVLFMNNDQEAAKDMSKVVNQASSPTQKQPARVVTNQQTQEKPPEVELNQVQVPPTLDRDIAGQAHVTHAMTNTVQINLIEKPTLTEEGIHLGTSTGNYSMYAVNVSHRVSKAFSEADKGQCLELEIENGFDFTDASGIKGVIPCRN